MEMDNAWLILNRTGRQVVPEFNRLAKSRANGSDTHTALCHWPWRLQLGCRRWQMLWPWPGYQQTKPLRRPMTKRGMAC